MGNVVSTEKNLSNAHSVQWQKDIIRQSYMDTCYETYGIDL